MNPIDQVKSTIAELENALLTEHPQMPLLLKSILAQLKSDPDVITLMTEEDIGIIVQGLKKQTKTEISASKTKGTSAKKQMSMSIGTDL